MTPQVVVTCGVGGVGKTPTPKTASAATRSGNAPTASTDAATHVGAVEPPPRPSPKIGSSSPARSRP